MAVEETGFPRVFRGYDPDEVDKTIARLRRELLASKTEFDRLSEQVNAATETSARLELELQQTDTPTFAGFGHAFDSILKRAEKEAKTIISSASADAHNIRLAAERERTQIVDIAKEHAKRLGEITEARATEILQEALSRSAAIVEAAEAANQSATDDAVLEAANIRRSSTTEATRDLSTAKREAEAIRSEAVRESAEMKLILATSATTSGVKLSKELLELLRINADAAAHRDEAEKEYLRKHNEAVHTTQQYIEHSQAELKNLKAQIKIAEFKARENADKARRELNALREAVDKRALSTLSSASQSAASIISAAEALATEIRQRAEASAREMLITTEQQRENFSKIFDKLGDLATNVQVAPKSTTTSRASKSTVKAAPAKGARAKTSASKPTSK